MDEVTVSIPLAILESAILVWRVKDSPEVLRMSGIADSDFVIASPAKKRDEALSLALFLADGNRLRVRGGQGTKNWCGIDWCVFRADDSKVVYD